MAGKAAKTNAARLLDRLGIAYTLRSYDYDPADLDAEKAAAGIGVPAEQVFKTLVVRGDQSGVMLAVIPSHRQLSLKALASLSGDRKVQPVPLKEVQTLTGYIRGGVTVLGCKKPYPVYGDRRLLDHDAIAVSAGQRGLLMVLAPDDYVRAVQATLGAIATDAPSVDLDRP
jgi:Cys-tRNA(Pro)/Cys-tRNA(Cys) deacylase